MMRVVGGHNNIRVERVKWPNRPHVQADGHVLGTDEFGTWIGLADADEVWCVPRDQWWVACWFARADAVAVDITTPAQWTEDRVTVVGLDFRVILRAGEPRLVGDDDFEENRLAFEYPSSVESRARTAADEALLAMQAGTPPFTWESASGWFAVLRAVG
jgi:protein associated with RNAse G/E